ncbi:MAG: ASCH domain-containing protein, partial [Bacilli bacterium]|nr:ASCH domain-containing protein [Bacilli bacterium]
MKVLSIRQPWASIIINGYKCYEFRSWKTNFRGKVLIHASKDVETEYLSRFESLGLEYPTSAILGSVEITDCVPVTEEFEDELIKKNELVYGATRGRAGYGFKVENIIKFDEVIPANGNLGFWDFYTPEEVMELMSDIKYGWIDDEGYFYENLDRTNSSKYKLLSPREIIKRGTGVCWDQVELERYYLRNNKL